MINSYDANGGFSTHTVAVTLQHGSFKKIVTYDIFSNCLGFGVMDNCVQAVMDEIGFEDDEPVTITLTDDSYDTLEVEIYCESDLEDMITRVEIIDYRGGR
jgi:hypothetical protein